MTQMATPMYAVRHETKYWQTLGGFYLYRQQQRLNRVSGRGFAGGKHV